MSAIDDHSATPSHELFAQHCHVFTN